MVEEILASVFGAGVTTKRGGSWRRTAGFWEQTMKTDSCSSTKISYEIGELVIASCPSRHRRNSGKPNRPAIILKRDHTSFHVAELTKRRTYDTDGTARIAIPNHSQLGLAEPSWLRSFHMSTVLRLQIRNHLGWVHHEVIDVLEKHMKLTSEDIRLLREVADRYHP
jgi:hypothetical protein